MNRSSIRNCKRFAFSQKLHDARRTVRRMAVCAKIVRVVICRDTIVRCDDQAFGRIDHARHVLVRNPTVPSVRWIPPGNRKPAVRPDAARHARTYEMSDRSSRVTGDKIVIDQSPPFRRPIQFGNRRRLRHARQAIEGEIGLGELDGPQT